MARPFNSAPSGCYAQAFRQQFASLLTINKLTQSEFARRVGVKQSSISNVLNGRHLPPLERMDYWAAVLRLVDQGRREFILMAHLAHAPSEVQSAFRDMRLAVAAQAVTV